jgi:glutamate synthase (ferredoxin)
VLWRQYGRKRTLAAMKTIQDSGLTGKEAVSVAFEANARDLARVGGGRARAS